MMSYLRMKTLKTIRLFQGVADESFRQALIDSIKQLPEREGLVLSSLYYDEELNLKRLGKC